MVFEKLLENIVGQLLDYESFGITGMELNYPPFKISYKGWKVNYTRQSIINLMMR